MSIFDRLLKFEYKNNIGLFGMTNDFFALYIKKIIEDIDKDVLIITSSVGEANKLNNYLNKHVSSFAFQVEKKYSDTIDSTFELETQKVNIINEIINNKGKKVIVTDVFSYISYLPSKDSYKANILNLKVSDTINYHDLVSYCEEMGYDKSSIVNKTGDYGVRGFVFDIFIPTEDFPIRIEFFGDEITSIKYFDPRTQRTIKKIENISILPFTNNLKIEDSVNISKYLDDYIVVYKDYSLIINENTKIVNEFKEDEKSFKFFDFNKIIEKEKIFYFDVENFCDFNLSKKVYYNLKPISGFFGNIEMINNFFINNKKTVIINLSTIDVNKFISLFDIKMVVTNENQIFNNKINIINSKLNEGFECEDYIFLTEYDLFNKVKKNINVSKFKYSSRIKSVNSLIVGDYVVHSLNGIGIYNGIRTLKKNNGLYDYLEILYAKNDKLYIPVSNINLISKYSAKEGYVPKINALNSLSWVKTKNKIKEKIRYEAERLLKVQAERELKKGFSFSEDGEIQLLFEDKFIYEETPDQLSAIREIKVDMESENPMDRLLCGDVGFGKTEVAFRAMLKAVLDNKQVIYLCPTTLLSKQQYEVACKRFVDVPVRIGLINRFITPGKVKKILSEYKKGNIDILFGTHRVLSKDVVSRDLGLLVIDEEQRFGVAHKEKIKEYKNDIDVLTLTATPIPRTLQMAILGLKNLSFIATPPKNRKSIQTYIVSEDEKIIKDVINREVSRGGQVFILYNRVKGIYSYFEKIVKLLPDVKITVAHGQMNKSDLEVSMNNFMNGDFDVLLCTTIIETGVDIPNVNTLIVIDANNFGLSQLYQIRGRIGRGERFSYAYLMYNKNKILTDSALKRLKTLKDFTELGSGFSIANRDLSIRGAGDILGAEQAGFIDSVGIDLYMKMLKNEIDRLKGIEVEEEEDTDISLVSNHIKDSYVSDEDLKIEIHRLIGLIDSKKKLIDIKSEIEDRFGKVDDEMDLYMNQKVFEKKLVDKRIFGLINDKNYLGFTFTEKFSNSLQYEDIFIKSLKISKNFVFEYKNKQIIVKIDKKTNKNQINLLNVFIDEIFI